MTTPRDAEKTATYTAEDRIRRWAKVDGPVRVFGSSWDVERVALFTDLPAIQSYVDLVLDHLELTGAYQDRAALPVEVVGRRGPRWAMYHPDTAKIGIPQPDRWTWACNELVVLHEVAHHLTPGVAHGSAFRGAFVYLLATTNHPVLAHLSRIAFLEAGLAVDDDRS